MDTFPFLVVICYEFNGFQQRHCYSHTLCLPLCLCSLVHPGLSSSQTRPPEQVTTSEKQQSRLVKTSNYSSLFPPQILGLVTDSCLFSTSSKASSIRGELVACLYLLHPRALCLASGTLVILHLRLRYKVPYGPYTVNSLEAPLSPKWQPPAFYLVCHRSLCKFLAESHVPSLQYVFGEHF